MSLPKSILKIAPSAFSSYSGGSTISVIDGIAVITIPKGCLSIGQYAFAANGSLKSVTFEEGSACTTIEDGAFFYCRGLSELVIPNSVTTMGDMIVNDVYLSKIVVPEKLILWSHSSRSGYIKSDTIVWNAIAYPKQCYAFDLYGDDKYNTITKRFISRRIGHFAGWDVGSMSLWVILQAVSMVYKIASKNLSVGDWVVCGFGNRVIVCNTPFVKDKKPGKIILIVAERSRL